MISKCIHRCVHKQHTKTTLGSRGQDRRQGDGVEPTLGGCRGAGPTWRGRSGSTGSHGGTVSVGAPEWARPKWTRPGRSLPVMEEPCSPGAGATVGVDGPGMNGGGMRVPAPKLPPFRQDQHNAGVATPT